MDARLVDQVIGSPVFGKLILLVCIAALFLYLRRKDTEGHSGAFLALLGLLLIRDFLSAYYPSSELLYLSDVFYLGFAVFILLAPFESLRVVLVLALGINVLFAALFIGIQLFDVPLGVPRTVFGYLLIADACLAGLGAFIKRKDHSTPSRHLVSLLWPYALLFLLSYSFFALVLGYDDQRFLNLVMPLSYGWLLAAVLFSLAIQEAEMVSALGYYEAAIDSLYSMFLNTGSALENGLSGQEVLKCLNKILVAETGADGGILLMIEGDDSMTIKDYTGFFPPILPVSERLQRTASGIEQYMKQAKFGFGDGLLGDVGKAGKNVFCPRADQDSRFAINNEDSFFWISSFMAVPLMIEDRILGVSAVVRTAPGSKFREADFDRFKLLANFGSFAVSTVLPSPGFAKKTKSALLEAKTYPDSIFRDIHEFLHPSSLPQFPGLSAAALTMPAPSSSGAYYDLFHPRKGKIIGVVAEAASQGLWPNLVLVMLRSVLQVLGRTDKDMASLLNWANKVLHGSIEQDQAPSVGLICMNMQTRELEYANAGNMGLLVYRRSTRTLDYITKSSFPLGKNKLAEYERIRLQLHSGDTAVLYTAGVITCADGRGNQFGRNALGRVVAHADMEVTAVVKRVYKALSAYGGSDLSEAGQTVLVIKVE